MWTVEVQLERLQRVAASATVLETEIILVILWQRLIVFRPCLKNFSEVKLKSNG